MIPRPVRSSGEGTAGKVTEGMNDAHTAPRSAGSHLLEQAAAASTPGSVEMGDGWLLNMELSNLAFQHRVVDLAHDTSIPLLERVRFLSILGSNLDEFFMTRVAGFQRQIALGHTKKTLDGMMPDEQLRVIGVEARRLLDRAYRGTLPAVLGELAEHDIELLRWDGLTPADRRYIRANYTSQLDAIISPVLMTEDGSFPHIRNLRPALIVDLAEREISKYAIIELPNDIPRLVPLPGGLRFVPLEDVIRESLWRLLDGRSVEGSYLFRVTRSGNLNFDSDNLEDLVEAVAETVARRPFQPAVRLEIDHAVPDEVAQFLLRQLQEEAETRMSHLDESDVYRVDGLVDLNRLAQIASLPIPDLKYAKCRHTNPLRVDPSIFEQLRRGDVLLRFPKHRFETTVERFIQAAATDPAVESISITLYRTSKASRIVKLLRRAHRNGKQITAMIEVKASFDETRNIEWARTLEAAGIRVLYGPATLKVHAKIASVRRLEEGRVRLYTYIGTGNLNASTAAAYTDLGLLTADARLGDEIADLFETMAGEAARAEYDELIAAPFNMRRRFLELIDRETKHANAGRGGGMSIKLNGIADREIIAALYRASAAGVTIDLNVRGICSLRPGVPGLSDNIRVISIAGRFLEHSRIYRFDNAGDPEFYIGSADWRGRNLSRRVEVVTPIHDPRHQETLDRILDNEFKRSTSWELQSDGSYIRQEGAA